MPQSFERNKQFARRLKVLHLLSNSHFGMTLTELRDAVIEQMGLTSISDKSIERDIKFLLECGYPIESQETDDPERKKVFKLAKVEGIKIFAPGEPVSVTELLALAAARDLLFPLAGTPLWEGIQSLWSKFKDKIPGPVWQHFERDRPNLFVRSAPRKDYSEKEGMLSALNRAVYQNKIVKVMYQSLRDDKPRERLLAPHCIVMDGSNTLFVVALDNKDAEPKPKPYKLDRFATVTVTDERFKPREDVDPEQLFSNSIGVFRSDEVHRFRVRFDKVLARWATETPFHGERTIELQDDGSVIIDFDGHFEEIVPRILGVGEHAEILEPPAARKRIAEIAKGLVQRYADAPE